MAKSVLNTGFFVGPITIPQITEQSVVNNLAWFIARYEEQFLKLLLGEDLYNAYVAGMNEGSPGAEWIALDNRLYKATTPKMSPVANYVYWFYIRNNATQSTGTGEVIMQSDKAIPVGSAVKAKLAWNDMVRQNKDLVAWLKLNPSLYPQYVEPSYGYGFIEGDVQLYKDRMEILKTVIPFL